MARHAKSVDIVLGASWRSKKPQLAPAMPSAEERAVPSCAKCRNLQTGEPAGCAKGHPFNPLGCGDFRDCSRQRDYFPHFYHHDMRR